VNLFSEKVTRVRRGGGVAAVIYNDVVTDPTCGAFIGSLGTAWPTIPAITLSCAQGAEALSRVASSAQVVSHITFPASSYEAWSGTSMATPHVSAVAALVWSCHPGLDAAAIRAALTSTARDLGDPGRDNAYGFGLVQARAALLSLGPSATCTVR
jgi:subtilisin family serine protease